MRGPIVPRRLRRIRRDTRRAGFARGQWLLGWTAYTARAIGASSTHIRDKVSGIRKLRAFDFFTEIVGKKGGSDPIFKGPNLEIKTYNIVGEQFAFHRALRSVAHDLRGGEERARARRGGSRGSGERGPIS